MGKALQCPECGARHPLDELAGVRTFRCSSCRRLLKVPPEVAGAAPGASGRRSGARGGGAGAGVGAASAGKAGAAGGAATQAAAAAGATARRLPPSQRGVDLKAPESDRAVTRAQRRTDRDRDGDAADPGTAVHPRAVGAAPSLRQEATRVPRLLRLFIWILAVPVGVVPVLVVGRMAGVVSIDTVMDVFVAEGWRRYLLPLVVLPAWAAVTATIVHLTVEGLSRVLGRPPEEG